MYKFKGNRFVVGSIPYNSPIGGMTTVWSVDDSGDESVKGKSTVEGGLQLLTHGPRPACGPGTRGQLWESFAASDKEDDHLDICQRRNGTYQWITR
jgi:hypothetical protein